VISPPMVNEPEAAAVKWVMLDPDDNGGPRQRHRDGRQGRLPEAASNHRVRAAASRFVPPVAAASGVGWESAAYPASCVPPPSPASGKSLLEQTELPVATAGYAALSRPRLATLQVSRTVS